MLVALWIEGLKGALSCCRVGLTSDPLSVRVISQLPLASRSRVDMLRLPGVLSLANKNHQFLSFAHHALNDNSISSSELYLRGSMTLDMVDKSPHTYAWLFFLVKLPPPVPGHTRPPTRRGAVHN